MSDMTVAKTIQAQLGGALMMMGAKDLVGSDTALSFRIGRNSSGGNKVRISLRPDDTYNVELWHVRGTNIFQVGDTYQAVYADQLKGVLRTMTGLYTSL
jgi:hypothetical protein